MRFHASPLLSILWLIAAASAPLACSRGPALPSIDAAPIAGDALVIEAVLEQPQGASTTGVALPSALGDVGWWPRVAFDAAGGTHLSYTDAYNGELHYAHEGPEGWSMVRVDTVGAVGKYSAVAVDAGGRPHLLYYNQDRQRLMYATEVGAEHFDPDDRRRPPQTPRGWLYEIVDEGPEVGLASRLLVAPDGTLHAFYYLPDRRLAHATRPPTPLGAHARWARAIIDPEAGGSHSIGLGLHLAPDGRLHISYTHWNTSVSQLRYGTKGPGEASWRSEVVSDLKDAGWKSDLILSDAGEPIIAYLTLKDRRVHLATRGPEGWAHLPLVQGANSLRMRRHGDQLTLAYEHLPERGLVNARLRLLSRDLRAPGPLNQGWSAHDPRPAVRITGHMDLGLDPSGRPGVAVYDGAIRGVKLWRPSAPGTQTRSAADAAGLDSED